MNTETINKEKKTNANPLMKRAKTISVKEDKELNKALGIIDEKLSLLDKNITRSDCVRNIVVQASESPEALEKLLESFIDIPTTKLLRLKGYNIEQNKKGEKELCEDEFTVNILPGMKLKQLDKYVKIALSNNKKNKLQ